MYIECNFDFNYTLIQSWIGCNMKKPVNSTNPYILLIEWLT